jgi:glycosyltransferase involved in cell wall biosynthesis
VVIQLFYCLFILAATIQCVYVLYFFIRIFSLRATKPIAPEFSKPVSIIICAKNEAENLRKNLPLILSQQYYNEAGLVNYEVIVVNDNSTDDTANVLQEMELRYDHLWDVISGEEGRVLQGKKFALSKGVAHAKHNWLLLTDADCAPASDDWLAHMVAPLATGKEIVAGYGGYYAAKGFLNAFIRWETLHTFLQYSAYALAGKPYMAVGRNLACTKDILLAAQKSDIWNALPSGDDDLLVAIAGNAQNTAIVSNKSAFTRSEAKSTLADWIKQKQRHLSTGKYYKEGSKLLLGAYATAHAALWLCFFVLLFSGFRYVAIIVFSVRCFIYWSLWAMTASKLKEKKLVYLFPLFDFGWMVYNFAFFPYITWKNKQTWK